MVHCPFLPSMSFQRVWSILNKARFSKKCYSKKKKITGVIEVHSPPHLECGLLSHQVTTYQVNLLMIIQVHSPMDDKLYHLHKDKSI